jgi:hypothetical protein
MDEVVVLFLGPQREQSGRPAGFGGGALMAAGRYGEGNGGDGAVSIQWRNRRW